MCMSCMEQPCMHVTGLSLSVKQFHRASLPYHHGVHHTPCVGRNVLICWVRSAIVFAQHIWGDEQASAVALSLQAVLLWQLESASLCHEPFSIIVRSVCEEPHSSCAGETALTTAVCPCGSS